MIFVLFLNFRDFAAGICNKVSEMIQGNNFVTHTEHQHITSFTSSASLLQLLYENKNIHDSYLMHTGCRCHS